MLKANNIYVHYGTLAALRGVSIEVNQGEIVTIVGPNGAGKSTLLLAISGILMPVDGSVSLDGTTITGRRPETITRKGISLVPEGRHVFARLTVAENLRMGLTIRKDKVQAEEDFEKILNLFPRLKDRLNSPGGRLSGGEQQMLVIGRAMLTKPKIMTIDEPSLGLAPLVIDNLWQVLTELRQKEGLTLLIVEQSTERALQASDRIYVLRNGQIQLTGTSAELADGAAIKQAYFGFEKEKIDQGPA
ncbi:MAG: ABC transporter ATP-binding protein [bacterium]|nr:ABC transporter ATP-binding protein [bacterium]